MIAEIFQGERDVADAFFLIAVFLFVVQVLIAASARPADPTRGTLIPLGLACLAFALLLL